VSKSGEGESARQDGGKTRAMGDVCGDMLRVTERNRDDSRYVDVEKAVRDLVRRQNRRGR
jgi:hypothetical protein